jgi:hypothetical protein
MEADLTRLELQLEQLLTLYQGVKDNNNALRRRIAELEAANKVLDAKVKDAAGRVEALLAQLPEA